MDRIRIIGGERLKGTIPISGAKNAALPLMIASLLTRETLVLKNVPRLADVTLLGRILGNHGVDITAVGKKVGQSTIDGQTFKLKAAEILNTTAPYEMVSRTRAKLARLGARIDLKGDTAMVTGVKGLTGAQVMAAQGETMIDSVSPRPRLRAARISSGSLASQHASSQTGVQKRHDVP